MKPKHLDNLKYIDAAGPAANMYKQIPSVVKELTVSWDKKEFCEHVGAMPIPSHESIIRIIHRIRKILFPGYFTHATINAENLEYYLGQETNNLFEDLAHQISLSFQYNCLSDSEACLKCAERGQEPALKLIQALPRIKQILATDIQAALEGDPAAKSQDEVIFSYPGLLAITTFRIAHELYELGVPFIPRIMTEHAHSLTGIDIHPGATIGESFFIDHGTGVVVGETTEIGNRVRLYQGVTLGALSLPRDAGERWRNKKRHPTIEDDVIVYSNTTILGGDTVIGARSIIGGNIWLTESVPPDTKVLLKKPKLIYSGNGKAKK